MYRLLLLAAFASGPAFAAEPVALSSTVAVEVTTMVAGKPQIVLREPDVVTPGDRLVFSTSYRSQSAKPLTRFVVTNPIPPSVAFHSASGPDATLSVDGGKSWGVLGQLTKPVADGTTRAAQAADVTHVRWTVATIAPGDKGSLIYRGNVR